MLVIIFYIWGAQNLYGSYAELAQDLQAFHHVVSSVPRIQSYDARVDAETFLFDLTTQQFFGNKNVEVHYKNSKLSSKKMNYDIREKRMVFEESVQFLQDEATMKSDVITAIFPADIRAEGDVSFLYKEFYSKSNKALYNMDKDQITLLNNVVVKHRDDYVKGDYVIFDLNLEKIVSKGRSKIKMSTERDGL